MKTQRYIVLIGLLATAIFAAPCPATEVQSTFNYGAASATTTNDGKQLPPPAPNFLKVVTGSATNEGISPAEKVENSASAFARAGAIAGQGSISDLPITLNYSVKGEYVTDRDPGQPGAPFNQIAIEARVVNYAGTTALIAFAGAASGADTAEATEVDESTSRPPYRNWTLAVEAGSTGAGLSGSWRFNEHVGVRAGFDYLEYSKNSQSIHDIHYDTKFRLMSEPLTLDVYPWKEHSFHISAGWMFNQNRLTGTAVDTGTILIDGLPFPVSRVGTLNLHIEQQLINPYLSFGGNFFYFDHAHRWALGGELGVVYTGEPKVSLTRSGPIAPAIDAAVREEQKHVEHWADQFKWWPVVKLTVSFSF